METRIWVDRSEVMVDASDEVAFAWKVEANHRMKVVGSLEAAFDEEVLACEEVGI